LNNNNDSKVVDLSYDNVELKPKIDEEPLNKKVNDKTEEDNNNNVLIQKQSKDETTIEILSDTATESEKIAVKGGRNVIDALNDIVQTLLPATIKSKKENV